jgi:DNA-binding response OmpR family regulator
MPTVLVIEDDPDMRELERTMLDCNGYDVTLATNGQEGLRALQKCRPCVILLDLMMPVMDGLAFLAEREKRHIGDRVPVICVSAAGEELLADAVSLGAQECIHKPADFNELANRVARYCESAANRTSSS